MATLWLHYGISMASPWERLGKSLGKAWEGWGRSRVWTRNEGTFWEKTSIPLRGTKKVVLLQSHSEEFAERTTTFMTFKVVSSLNLNEPSLSSGGFVFWVRTLRNCNTILNQFLSGALQSDCEFHIAILHHQQLLKLLLVLGFSVGSLFSYSDSIFKYFS